MDGREECMQNQKPKRSSRSSRCVNRGVKAKGQKMAVK